MILLDAAATQPVRPEILDAVMPLFTQQFGNAASHHEAGEEASRALEWARSLAGSLLGVRASRVVFTSGGTESNALGLHGIALAEPRGRHIVVSAIEHPSVLQSVRQLEKWHGFEVSVVPVGASGVVSPTDLAALLRPDTTLVTVMAVNNEVGTIQPVEEIAALAQGVGARLHVDAVQAGSWLPLTPLAAVADSLAISGHKLGGLKGAGLLALGRGVRLEPLLDGGGQEGGLRSGTVNVPGAVSTALALQAAAHDATAYVNGQAPCGAEPGDYLAGLIMDGLDLPVRLSAASDERVPGIVSLLLAGVHAESVLIELGRHGVLASSGSACAAGSTEPSAVLTAMGIAEDEAHTALRLSFSPALAREDLARAADAVIDAVRGLTGR